MMTPPQIRDAVNAYIDDHERRGCPKSPPGQPCWTERVNVVAYLCHTLGIRGDRLHRDVAALVGEYDLACANPGCKHELQ